MKRASVLQKHLQHRIYQVKVFTDPWHMSEIERHSDIEFHEIEIKLAIALHINFEN